MFGSFTDKLAIVGVCAIVFWIICWLILVSKNDRIPGWISSLATAIGCVLTFCTVLSSAIFSLPLFILYRQASDAIEHKAFNKGIEFEKAAQPGALKLAEQEGYNKGVKECNRKYNLLCTEYDWLYDMYRTMYEEYSKGTPFEEIEDDLGDPQNWKRDE